MNTNLWSKRKKVTIACGVILGIILILFLRDYYFSPKGNWEIYLNNKDGLFKVYQATDIVYLGPDINSKSEYYSGKDGTNGTICIYTFHSRFDKMQGSWGDKQLYIVGNISKVYNQISKTYLEGYWGDEIDKGFYLNSEDYSY